MIETQVTVSGAVFDGRATRAVDDFLDDAKERIADQGVNEVRSQLGRVLQNPTGFYESRIVTDRQQDDRQITDSGVIYGPWLAGVGSRNATSSFKGYEHWRRATQELQGEADKLAQQVLPPRLAEMNS